MKQKLLLFYTMAYNFTFGLLVATLILLTDKATLFVELGLWATVLWGTTIGLATSLCLTVVLFDLALVKKGYAVKKEV